MPKLLPQLFVPTPTPRPPQPEDSFTPGQQFGLQYSRDRYQDGSYQINPPHSQYNPGDQAGVTSFYGAIDRLPDGQYINYPTFWGGKVIDPRAALVQALAYEKQKGQQFARYPTEDAANYGEMQVVHPVMDADSRRVMAWPESQARLRAMLPPGGQ